MDEKPLNQQLFDEPFRFEFFQTVRLLEKIFPERQAVGREPVPTKEVARFRSHATTNFSASQVYEINEVFEKFSDEAKYEVIVNFMGMIGPLGVLPMPYTETVMERIRYRDTSLYSFLDIFTHRAVSLFYRAWEKYRFPVQYERGNDDFTQYLFDLIGLGTNGLRGRLFIEEEALLPYAGLLAQKPHSSSVLEQILADYFGVPAKVKQFFGQWLDLDKESITRLGQVNSGLGTSAIIGAKIWDDQSKFRVVFGAMGFREFQGFLPNGSAYHAMKEMIRFIAGDEYDFDVQLKLKAKEVPGTILTTRAKRRPMLGWTSFLKTKPFTEDDDQLVLQVSS